MLGEIELAMSHTPTSRVTAFNFFRDGTKTERQGEIADPVALMGLAWFYQLDDATLKAPEYADPSLEELRQMEASQRTLKALNLYREAARSGDAFANFLAGQYTDIALKRTEQNRRLVETYLKAAMERGHKRAATYLAKVRSGGE